MVSYGAYEAARKKFEREERRKNGRNNGGHQRDSNGHRGGFGESEHGWISSEPVTFALGWGTKQGHTLIADGHLDNDTFQKSRNHDHYGPGEGPNNNGTLRRRYSGPNA